LLTDAALMMRCGQPFGKPVITANPAHLGQY